MGKKIPILVVVSLVAIVIVLFFLGIIPSLSIIDTNDAGSACWKSGASCSFQWDTLPTSKTIADGYGTGKDATNPYAGMDIDFASSTCTVRVNCLCGNPECGGAGVTGSDVSSCSIYDAGGGWVGVSIGGEAVAPRTPPTACDYRIWRPAGQNANVNLNIVGGATPSTCPYDYPEITCPDCNLNAGITSVIYNGFTASTDDAVSAIKSGINNIWYYDGTSWFVYRPDEPATSNLMTLENSKCYAFNMKSGTYWPSTIPSGTLDLIFMGAIGFSIVGVALAIARFGLGWI